MSEIFKQVMMDNVPGSNFDLSHSHKTSLQIGDLVPTLTLEVIPGDKFKFKVDSLVRMSPMVAPVMHNIDVTHHLFYVPNRLQWDDWEDWITGKTEVAPPHIVTGTGLDNPGISNYLGYRQTPTAVHMNAFPAGAYYLIYDEYYRAQYIETTEVYQKLVSGTNIWVRNKLLASSCEKRAWRHDYFTSALPFPQVGDAVKLPLITADQLDVKYDPSNSGVILKNGSVGIGPSTTLTTNSSSRFYDGAQVVAVDPDGSLYVDPDADAVTVNDLREALALQRWLEKEARTGQRYTEHLRAFFGVTSSDKRLDRPEYIGGAKQNVVISEVLTTGASTNNPVGSLQGHGISAAAGQYFEYEAEEHGYILCITSVRPKSAYYQGLHKTFYKKDRYDYANPMFARLGEQPVLNGEVYSDCADIDEFEGTFGYLPIFSDYKILNDRVTGDFTTTLDHWHMSRKFTTLPTLNETFIHCIDDSRIFADTSNEDKVYMDIYFNINAYRKLPKFATPSIVG